MKKKQQVTGAQALVDSLAKAGTEVLFGYPGGAVLDIFNCIHDSIKSLLEMHHCLRIIKPGEVRTHVGVLQLIPE